MDRYPDRLEGVQAFFFNSKYSFVLKKKSSEGINLSAWCLQPVSWQLAVPRFNLEAVPMCPVLLSKASVYITNCILNNLQASRQIFCN